MANLSVPVLPPELLHIVFANLKSHADIYSLCLVSKYFYTVAIQFLYRRLKIPHTGVTCGKLVTPLHALLTSQQQERLLRFSAEREDGLVRGSGKESGLGKDLGDCGKFVREFEVAPLVGIMEDEEVSEIRKEIVESAIENMSLLESFAWNTSNLAWPRISNPLGPRTSRISASLARKPRLRSLSLSNILDTDLPLLQLHPLHSVTFILDSNFASLAHRLSPSTADYDIIRNILKTSAGTLKSLSLIDTGGLTHYEDEGLLFGGGRAHGSVFEESPKGTQVTPLSALESLTLVRRQFTIERLEVLTQAINFNNLRRLEVLFCDEPGLLLSAITPPEESELDGGAGGASQEENKIFPNLRTFRIRATQSAVTKFLQCFRGLQDLHYELECDPTDWAAPGGNRRQFSPIRFSKDFLEAIATHHGNTLRRLAILSFGQQKTIDEPGVKILTGKCRVLEKLCCPVLGSSFGGQPAAVHTPNLSTLYLRLQSLISESEAYEFTQKVLQQIPELKTVRMLVGRDRTRSYAFRVCPGGVVESFPASRFLQERVEGWEVWGLDA